MCCVSVWQAPVWCQNRHIPHSCVEEEGGRLFLLRVGMILGIQSTRESMDHKSRCRLAQAAQGEQGNQTSSILATEDSRRQEL